MRPEDVPPGPLLNDTDVFSYLLDQRGRHEEFAALTEGHFVAMSFASVGEVRSGALRKGLGPRRTEAMERALQRHVVIMPNTMVVDSWAQIMAKLHDRLKGGGVNDMWTAACALAYDLPVVTNNLSDFQAIEADFPQLLIVHPDT